MSSHIPSTQLEDRRKAEDSIIYPAGLRSKTTNRIGRQQMMAALLFATYHDGVGSGTCLRTPALVYKLRNRRGMMEVQLSVP